MHSPDLKRFKLQIDNFCANKGILLVYECKLVHNAIIFNIKQCSVDLLDNCLVTMQDIWERGDVEKDHTKFFLQKLLINKNAKNKNFSYFQGLAFCFHNLKYYFSGDALELMNYIYSIIYVDSLAQFQHKITIGQSSSGFKPIIKNHFLVQIHTTFHSNQIVKSFWLVTSHKEVLTDQEVYEAYISNNSNFEISEDKTEIYLKDVTVTFWRSVNALEKISLDKFNIYSPVADNFLKI